MDNTKDGKTRCSYCLVQLKSSAPYDISSACKEIVDIPAVVAASALNGLFDIIAKIEGSEEDTKIAIDNIRSLAATEFAAPFDVTHVFISEGQLMAKSNGWQQG